MAVGRISGPLLKDNLLRNGVNLAFETNLLYLDVVNRRIGVNTSTPTNDLSINGTTRSTNLQVTTSATLGTITLSGNTISSSSSTINLLPSGAGGVVYQGTINVGSMTISSNIIAATGSNTNIEITPTGTGAVEFNSNVNVYGNIHATGNITADGNITLGNANTDTVSFGGEVNSDILPSASVSYNIGSSSLKWSNVWTNVVNANTFNINTFTANSLVTSGTPSITISGNTISANATNTDINFTTSGTGGLQIGNFRFYNNAISNTVANSVTNFVEPSYNFTASIAPAAPITLVSATIIGNTLTFTSSSGGTVGVGQLITGGTALAGTIILSGSGNTWTVNLTQTSSVSTATAIVMTVTSVSSGVLSKGIYITSGATTNTLIIATNAESSAVTGTGGAGTYLVNISQTVSSRSMVGTGSGYVKFNGTYGIVIPTGSIASRPLTTYTETGMVRFNTDLGYVEVYNGFGWFNVAGTSVGVTSATAQDIGVQSALAIG